MRDESFLSCFLSAKSGVFLWLLFSLSAVHSLAWSFSLFFILFRSLSLSLRCFFLFRGVCSLPFCSRTRAKENQKRTRKSASLSANIGIFSQLFLSLSKGNNLNNNNNTLCALVVLRVILIRVVIVTAQNKCMRARER